MGPTVRSFSAAFDPLALVELYPKIYPGLLESRLLAAAGGARYDILPIASGEALLLQSGRLSGPHAERGGFLKALEAWWRELSLPSNSQASSLPFTGGWLLYLAYELAAEIEPRLVLPPVPDSVGALALRTPAAWICDRASGACWLIAEPGHEGLLEQFEAHVASVPQERSQSPRSFDIEIEPEERFLSAVRCALEYTAAGDVYQTNLSRLWRARSAEPVAPVGLYRRLRETNPAPYAALLRHGDFAVLSSSPERLLCIRGGELATRPIAGTRPRGASPAEDAALIASLLANEKERAEHVMLIDLERNDVGKVCKGGSVHVDEFMSVETYAHVHHIVSSVRGNLRADATPVDAIRALFPGGTITGCPKFRCMQIIAELEASGRGAYTGSLGYLNRDGSCDLNILIRTLTVQAERISFRAGAGIVADSQPNAELAETCAKAEGLLRALKAPP